MRIGQLVKSHIKQIFLHCDNVEHGEIDSLQDLKYSKKTFGINFPFCRELNDIQPGQSRRYWTEVYLVRGRQFRVTSQWYQWSEQLFVKYLQSKNIALNSDLFTGEKSEARGSRAQQAPSSRSNSRYGGNPIGNAQNLFIRNILSSLGLESFNEADWDSTKDYFCRKCAYCGRETELVMEHAIPINRQYLGEHRLGNIVPSCQLCNSNKGGKDFKEFLGENAQAITRIEEYMNSRNYVPLEDNQQMKMILEMAHKEVASLADRYISIISELFAHTIESK